MSNIKTFIKEFIAWLKAIYTKPIAAVVPEAPVTEPTIETTEDKPVSEPIVDVNPVVVEPTVAVGEQPAVAPAPVTVINAVESDLDAFAAKLKSILVFAGHDVEAVFEEVVALAKKL